MANKQRFRTFIDVNCTYCGTPLKRPDDKARNKDGKYFCDKSHYFAWMNGQKKPQQKCYTEEQMIRELNRVTSELGHPPSYEEMKMHGEIHPKRYQTRWGTWEQVKRLTGWKPEYECFKADEVPPGDGAWLSGLIDGEGCFRLQGPSPNSGDGRNSRAYAPEFCLGLRLDSLAALGELCRIIGSKSSYHIDNRDALIKRGQKNSKPAFKFFLRDLPTIAYHLIPILEKYPLRTKKRYDVIIFKVAVNVLLNKWLEGRKNQMYTDSERDLLARLFLALQEIKKFESTFEGVIAKYDLPIDLPPTPSTQPML